jgi:hypothetical protein
MLIKKYEEAPCILVYEDAFDAENFIELIEEEAQQSWPYMEWMSSQTGDDDNLRINEYRTSLEIAISPLFQADVERLNPIKSLFVEKIFPSIDECIWDYRKLYDLELQSDNGFALLKYLEGGEYHIHHDHGPQNSRVLSLVASFGEAEEGGELEFPYFNVKIKLNKNSLVLFPSNFPYSHIAHPVISGVKYSLVTWFI